MSWADLWASPWVRAGVTLAAAAALAWLGRASLGFIVRRVAPRTNTDLDEIAARALQKPLVVTVLAVGVSSAMDHLTVPAKIDFAVHGVLKTIAAIVWTIAVGRIGSAVLQRISGRATASAVLQRRTLPVFDILFKVSLIGAAIYATFLAWHVDLTAWLASAGVLGIAIGFAAKDTLANLFAGIFILADGPYNVGDFIVLEDGLRGRVNSIGLRSTRIVTMDDIEITVPNATMGNTRIVNETGGPYVKQRVRIPVGVAYPSDPDQVRAVLLEAIVGIPQIAEMPRPMVRFVAMGESARQFQLLVWVEHPSAREAVVDRVNDAVFKALRAANIEIPYNKLDVFVRQMVNEHED